MADLLAALKKAGLVSDKDAEKVRQEQHEADLRREKDLLSQAANRQPRSRSVEAEPNGQASSE
jgi:hypothetical protein